MKTQKERNTLIAYLEGELDHHSAPDVREELDAQLADERIKNLVFDMRDLTFMDSSGIGVLIGRYRIVARRGGKVGVRGMNPQVDKLFTLSGLHRIMEKNGQGGTEK